MSVWQTTREAVARAAYRFFKMDALNIATLMLVAAIAAIVASMLI